MPDSTKTITPKVDAANNSILGSLGSFVFGNTQQASDTGRSIVAPITGATDQLSEAAKRDLIMVSEGTSQALINTGQGAGQGAQALLYGVGQGTKDVLSTGLGEGLGGALSNIGTGAAQGAQNLAIGLIPAVLIGVLIILALGTAKGVSGA